MPVCVTGVRERANMYIFMQFIFDINLCMNFSLTNFCLRGHNGLYELRVLTVITTVDNNRVMMARTDISPLVFVRSTIQVRCHDVLYSTSLCVYPFVRWRMRFVNSGNFVYKSVLCQWVLGYIITLVVHFGLVEGGRLCSKSLIHTDMVIIGITLMI